MKKTVRAILACAICLAMAVAMMFSAVAADASGKSVLYKKSALFVGDSISYGSQDSDEDYNKDAWAGRIGVTNDMDYVNASVSGSSCSTIRGENRIYKQLLAHEGARFDYVILHGGVNDAWSLAPVGEMTDKDCFDLDRFDTTTFAGGLEEMFYYATTLYPDARIGYIMNFESPMCQRGTVKDMDEYFAEARKICAKWDMPYLDLYGDKDFCYNELRVDSTEFLPDYIHPNADGYDILYPVIEEWMETLRGYNEPAETEPIATQATTQATTGAQTTTLAPEEPAAESRGCRSAISTELFAVVAVSSLTVGAVLTKGYKNKKYQK
ncbi:MAG: SGNH/GDSL hydrolase family protein [Clostridia bacterium]|nr:SGNH/GDSL hydrolase family protein [Clostridia bacterium]